MKRTLLFVLALIASGCADAGRSAFCEGLAEGSPLDDVRSCAEQGYANAQGRLGVMYFRGDGVPEDDAEAVRWYRLAAEQGDALGQANLGLMYALGQGVPEDVVLAYMWFNLAAAQGNLNAQSDKDILLGGYGEQQMTREQIAEAQRLSREWLEAHPSGN